MTRWTFSQILAISCIPSLILAALWFAAAHWNG